MWYSLFSSWPFSSFLTNRAFVFKHARTQIYPLHSIQSFHLIYFDSLHFTSYHHGLIFFFIICILLQAFFLSNLSYTYFSLFWPSFTSFFRFDLYLSCMAWFRPGLFLTYLFHFMFTLSSLPRPCFHWKTHHVSAFVIISKRILHFLKGWNNLCHTKFDVV